MTAYRFVTLTCDACGEISDGGMDRTVKAARATARAEGWAHDGRGDTCPSHNGYRRTSYGWERASQPTGQERAGRGGVSRIERERGDLLEAPRSRLESDEGNVRVHRPTAVVLVDEHLACAKQSEPETMSARERQSR